VISAFADMTTSATLSATPTIIVSGSMAIVSYATTVAVVDSGGVSDAASVKLTPPSRPVPLPGSLAPR